MGLVYFVVSFDDFDGVHCLEISSCFRDQILRPGFYSNMSRLSLDCTTLNR